MRLLSGWFIEKWPNKIINIHPSLLPAFKGTNSHAEVINSGVKINKSELLFEKIEDSEIEYQLEKLNNSKSA